MYKLKLSHREKKEIALTKWILIALAAVGLFAVVWLAWLRPIQKDASISTYTACVTAGNPIQETYPEVCLTKDGKRFTNPEQDQAHKQSLEGSQTLTPPTDPSLLFLDITEWKVRIPLDVKTFDLLYSYLEDGLSDHIIFSYKRLVNVGVCPGDIGLTLQRRTYEGQPPYSIDNPAPLAHIDGFYYFAATAGSPCYDTKKPDQVALVKQIAGDKSLTQATTALLGKLEALPTQ